MEATHDTRTTEKGHDLDVAAGRGNAELARALAAPGRRRQQIHPRAFEPRGWIGRLPGSGLPGGRGWRARRRRLHRGVLRGEIDDHRARLAPLACGARLESVEAGQGARAPAGSPDRLRHRLRLRRGGDVPHLASYGNGAGLGGASAHRRGRPRASRQRHRIAPGPRAGRGGRATLLTPTAARRRAWPEARGRPWKRPRRGRPRNTRPPGRVADTLSAAGRATCRGLPGARLPWPARSPRPTAPLWPSRAR